MKLMYLAKRNPAYASSEAFRPRWRQHGALAMSMPSWRNVERYVQADVQPPSPAGSPHEFDGVGITWLARLEVGSDRPQEATRDGARLLEDECLAFDGPVLPRGFLVDEQVLRSHGPADHTAYLLFEDAEEATRAAHVFAELAVNPEPRRIVMNRVSDRTPAPDPVYTYRGIVEVSSAERAGLDAILVAAQQAGVRPDLEVVTRECLLWDGGPVEQGGDSAA